MCESRIEKLEKEIKHWSSYRAAANGKMFFPRMVAAREYELSKLRKEANNENRNA